MSEGQGETSGDTLEQAKTTAELLNEYVVIETALNDSEQNRSRAFVELQELQSRISSEHEQATSARNELNQALGSKRAELIESIKASKEMTEREKAAYLDALDPFARRKNPMDYAKGTLEWLDKIEGKLYPGQLVLKISNRIAVMGIVKTGQIKVTVPEEVSGSVVIYAEAEPAGRASALGNRPFLDDNYNRINAPIVEAQFGFKLHRSEINSIAISADEVSEYPISEEEEGFGVLLGEEAVRAFVSKLVELKKDSQLFAVAMAAKHCGVELGFLHPDLADKMQEWRNKLTELVGLQLASSVAELFGGNVEHGLGRLSHREYRELAKAANVIGIYSVGSGLHAVDLLTNRTLIRDGEEEEINQQRQELLVLVDGMLKAFGFSS